MSVLIQMRGLYICISLCEIDGDSKCVAAMAMIVIAGAAAIICISVVCMGIFCLQRLVKQNHAAVIASQYQ